MKTEYKMIDFSSVIDWLSLKLLGASIGLYLLKINIDQSFWSKTLGVLSAIALISTIVYNVLKIYEVIKNKK